MAKTIKITTGKTVISVESDDAGVPDVTQDAGPDLMKLQEDAMANPNEANAEFNAAEPDSQVEKDDKPQAAETANESFFNAFFGFEDGDESTVTDSEPARSDTPVTPPETSDTPPADSNTNTTDDSNTTDNGAGEITESDGVTTIDTGDTVITISTNNDTNDTTPAPAETEPKTTDEPPAESTDATPPTTDDQDTSASIESMFAAMGL